MARWNRVVKNLQASNTNRARQGRAVCVGGVSVPPNGGRVAVLEHVTVQPLARLAVLEVSQLGPAQLGAVLQAVQNGLGGCGCVGALGVGNGVAAGKHTRQREMRPRPAAGVGPPRDRLWRPAERHGRRRCPVCLRRQRR